MHKKKAVILVKPSEIREGHSHVKEREREYSFRNI